MRSKLLVTLFSILLTALIGCAGSDDEPAGAYGEACGPTHACAEGLQCLSNVCSIACNNASVCQMANVGNTCVGGTCYTACTPTTSCPAGLHCAMVGSTSGTCRP